MMTEMLLCSDLKGFVASPAYYFESNDEAHTKALDNLLMVQGWRRYKRVPILRYRPEVTLTYVGTVNKMLVLLPMQLKKQKKQLARVLLI